MVAARKADYESRRAAVFAEIQEALVRARVAQKLVTLYRDTLRPQTQAVLKSTVAAYQGDRTDFLNLLDSQNIILDVELNYIKVVSELETRLADLERAVGTELPRTTSTPTSNSSDVRQSSFPAPQEVQP
jgi:outer membrane protein TolC